MYFFQLLFVHVFSLFLHQSSLFLPVIKLMYPNMGIHLTSQHTKIPLFQWDLVSDIFKKMLPLWLYNLIYLKWGRLEFFIQRTIPTWSQPTKMVFHLTWMQEKIQSSRWLLKYCQGCRKVYIHPRSLHPWCELQIPHFSHCSMLL